MRIKLSTNFPGEPIIRQTPGSSGLWNGCQFLVNDPGATECDFWVVLEGVAQEEKAVVDQGITVFFALEPPISEEYEPKFLRQFDLVIASHPKLPHRNYRNDCQGLPWHVGIDRGPGGDRYLDPIRCTIDYDRFAGMAAVQKTALMSVIVSDQAYYPGHRDRLKFVEALKRKWGDDLHVFGRGTNPIRDKFEAIAPYKYNIALENSVVPHYWTEKLADALLSFAYPIYWGCPNIYEYFPAGSLTTIDVTNIDQALAIIDDVVSGDLATANPRALAKARELVLTRYNIFELARRACLSMPAKPSRSVTLKPGAHFYNPYELRRLVRRIPRIPSKVRRLIRGLQP
jgi:hypothetical protein